LSARDRAAPEAQEALSKLCAAYWYPLYAYVRRRGHDAEAARDLTQGFFTRLLDPSFLRSVDPAKGRFRAFLLAACKNYLTNEYDRAHALKRGGAAPLLSIDLPDAEARYRLEPAHILTAERLYERRWALTLLEATLDALGREFHDAGKRDLFDRLRVILTGVEPSVSYAEVGEALGMTEGAVKKAAQRIRDRYRQILRERIAETVGNPDLVEDEIRALFTVLGS
jgi:RNA polymerase sigma factor (sigma-70 family)